MNTQALLSQLLIGLINGSFYALLSLGLALIFGMLNIVNATHGAQYMMGAFCAYLLLKLAGINYWWALLLAPLAVGAFAWLIERILLRPMYRLDHLYGFILTWGLSWVIEGLFRLRYGSSGLPYSPPPELQGGFDLGFVFLPAYRCWVVVAATCLCLACWYVVERTKLGSYLRAARENPVLLGAFGIKVPRMMALTYCLGVALAAFAGVLAAPIYQVSPLMGSNLLITIFAVVVIGGMGSMSGAIVSGLLLGLAEGLTKYYWPPASSTVVFALMALTLLFRESGLFGRSIDFNAPEQIASTHQPLNLQGSWKAAVVVVSALVVLAAPMFVYPAFAMNAMCLALFASAFNLLVGFGGLMSFGHAAFFGIGSYVTAHCAKTLGLTPELCLVLAVFAASLIGLLFGWLSTRRRGIYFTMVTLALAQLVYFICLQVPWTGGEDGIQAVPRGYLFGFIDLEDTMHMYLFVVCVCVGGILLISRIVHSPFGYVLDAIRQNESRAISLGYDARTYKLITFVISAGLAGLAGGLRCLVFQLAPLSDVHWSTSGEVVLMTLMGGLGTIWGPSLGALLLVSMQHYLAGFGSWVLIIQGTLFVLCVLTFRTGIVGFLRQIQPKLLHRRARNPVTADLSFGASHRQ